MASLSLTELRQLRLRSLLLADHDFTKPEEVVGWFGAMQAQDLASVKWSLGLRLPQLVEPDIDAAIESGSILRTWPMRGTIHMIPAQDARWMLETMGIRALSGVAKRWEYLGLDRATVDRAAEHLADALRGGRRLTRAEAADTLIRAGIDVNGQRLYHLLWHASQVGITCIGPTVGKDQTFVLLEEWAPNQRELTGEVALAELAWRYFRSHGPALVTDYSGWAGIAVTSARKAIAANAHRVSQIESEFGDMWLPTELLDQSAVNRGAPVATDIAMLPGFDEFMLGYKDRRAFMDPEHMAVVVPGNNGIFKPTIVDAGRVVGTWKRSVTKTKVKMEPIAFGRFTVKERRGFEKSALAYGRYLELPVHVVDA